MKDTTLLFTLTDSDNIQSRDPVRLALVPIADQPPQLAVQLDGIGTAVTPQARIPAVGRIADDYGIDRGVVRACRRPTEAQDAMRLSFPREDRPTFPLPARPWKSAIWG